jgi:hypothetical protein
VRTWTPSAGRDSPDGHAVVRRLLGQTASALSSYPTCSALLDATSHAGTTGATSCSGAAAANYDISYLPGTASVDKAPLSVTAPSPTSTYGAAASGSPTYSGFVHGETAAVLDTTPTCVLPTATTHAGTSTTTCSDGGDDDDSFTYTSGTATVKPAPLSVTASSPSSRYGSSPPSAVPSYRGFVNGENATLLDSAPSCASPVTAMSHVGTYPTSCSGGADGDYTLSYSPGTATVTPAPLTVVADNASRPYDEPDPAFTYTLTGFVNGDTAAVVSGSPTLSTTATRTSAVGTYPINTAVGTLAARDYAFTTRGATLSITRAATKLVAEPFDPKGQPGARYGLVAATVTYGSLGKPAVGVPVSFASGSTALCTATTDSTGRAGCALTERQQRVAVAQNGYTATFAGTQDLAGSSASAAVRRTS